MYRVSTEGFPEKIEWGGRDCTLCKWENTVWLEVSGITFIEKYMDKLWGSYGMFLPQRRLRQVLHFVLWMEVCTTLFYISWPPYSPQLTIREPYILYMYWYDDEDPSYSRLALMWFIWENGVIWCPFYPFEHMCDLLYSFKKWCLSHSSLCLSPYCF